MPDDRDLKFALRLARESIPRLRKAFDSPHQITTKPGAGIVTETDRAIEAWVREEVARHDPSHRVLGEEEGFQGHAHGPCWVVDPVDGTTNFAAGTPLFAFSLGLIVDGVSSVAVCVDPMREEIWSAASGRGARLNGIPLRCPEGRLNSESCLAVPSSRGKRLERVLARVTRRAKLRNTGSTVLNGYVAGRRFAACLATNARLWDIAACSLIVLEAGGRVTTDRGRAIFPLSDHPGNVAGKRYQFFCACDNLHEKILAELIRDEAS